MVVETLTPGEVITGRWRQGLIVSGRDSLNGRGEA